MNPQPELQSDALRSEIDTTRERMDETIDALGNRLEGRHLIDELIGFFRGRSGDGSSSALGERIAHSTEAALHSIVDTVKAHPIPTLMVGAGLGMLVYESRSRKRHSDTTDGNLESATVAYSEYTSEPYPEGESYATGVQTGTEATGGAGGVGDKARSATGQAKEKLSHLGDKTREQMNHARERGREKWDTARERLSQLGSDVQARGRELYGTTRQRVVTAADQHPLELALGCLAAGFMIGLAVPTPTVVHRRLGPSVDQLRDRTRAAGSELIEKGKRVVQAATHAAKVEAKTQGLSVANLRGQGAGGKEGTGEQRTETTPPSPAHAPIASDVQPGPAGGGPTA